MPLYRLVRELTQHAEYKGERGNLCKGTGLLIEVAAEAQHIGIEAGLKSQGPTDEKYSTGCF